MLTEGIGLSSLLKLANLQIIMFAARLPPSAPSTLNPFSQPPSQPLILSPPLGPFFVSSRVSRSLIWSLWEKGGRSILVSAAQHTSLPVTAGQVSAGGEAAAMQREREREREREKERNGGVPVVQLSLLSSLQNICPSNVAAASLSPREVACPAQDGQVCAGPGSSVIKRPSCAVTSGIEAGVIHDPVSAPLEGHTQTLTGQLRVKEHLGAVMARLPHERNFPPVLAVNHKAPGQERGWRGVAVDVRERLSVQAAEKATGLRQATMEACGVWKHALGMSLSSLHRLFVKFYPLPLVSPVPVVLTQLIS
ncbi:hypothetical protein FQN60_011845, partial [Etheostoma spectabile]